MHRKSLINSIDTEKSNAMITFSMESITGVAA